MYIKWISRSFSTIRVNLADSGLDRPSISLRTMEQIFPSPVDDVDPRSVYESDIRLPVANRPWVMCNMISSTDGGVALDGVSGGLGGPADKVVFSAIRSLPDVIVVASGTVIAENYRTAQTPPDAQRQRLERGQPAVPRIAIVTQSLNIDPSHRVFDGDVRPIVITSESSPAAKRMALAEVADIIIAGESSVELETALEQLGANGAQIVLLEGGPTLNGAFVDADLVDELCLSFAPMMLGGDGPRIVARSSNADAHSMRLERILHQDGYLFHRYIRVR